MRFTKLNGTALEVSALCLGTVNYGTDLPKDEAKRQMSRFVEMGGNFLDTAHVYGDWGMDGLGLSERVIGEWLKETGSRDRVILSTKGAHPRLNTMDVPRVSQAEIATDLEESLRFLGTDSIDLYFLHRDDPRVPTADILGWLEKARREGKIRHYGCSNWSLSRIREAADAAGRDGLEGFVCNQMMWSLADINYEGLSDKTFVTMDADTFRYHRENGLNAMAYMSVAKGYFMRRASGKALPKRLADIYTNESNEALYRLMDDANDIGFSPLDLSLCYLMQQPMPTVPIASFNDDAQLSAAMACCDRRLPEPLMEAIAGIKRFVYK